MARKTTAEFLVRIEYRGPEKKFGQLFSWSNLVDKLTKEKIKSETIELKPVAMYSDDKKIRRAFFKSILDITGLKRAPSRDLISAGEYNLGYATTYKLKSHYRVEGDLYIILCGWVVEVVFEDNTAFRLDVWDRWNDDRASIPSYRNYASFERWGKSPDETYNFNMAAPDVNEKVATLLKDIGSRRKETFKILSH